MLVSLYSIILKWYVEYHHGHCLVIDLERVYAYHQRKEFELHRFVS